MTDPFALWQNVIGLFGWNTVPVVLLATLAITALSFRVLPTERRDIRNSLLFLVASLIGILASTVFHRLELPGMASTLQEVFLIIQGIALIRLWAIFLFRLVLPKLGVSAPRISEDIVTFAAYFVWGMVRLRYAGMDLSGIVTTSALVTAVVAFSMQDTLGNVLGGIALQLDKSVEVGDWIKADDVVGRVVDIRWRSTVVETRNWETVVIPNSQLMKNKFSVLGQRNGQPVQWRRWVWFNVDLKTAPFHVIQTAEAAIRTAEIANVADQPPPNCVLMEFEKNYGRYALRYWLTDLALDDPTDSAVRTHLYTAFQRAGIRLATPEESRHIVKESEKHEQAVHQREVAHRLAALQKVELFNTLSGEELATIADRLQYTPFARGEVLTRQGAVAHWLYILTEGEVDVFVEMPEGEKRWMATLTEGSFFGEMGLMTGSPRSSTVVARSDVECYRLDKESFEGILRARPSLADEISRILTDRALEREQRLEQMDAAARDRQASQQHTDILNRIRQFFGLHG
jgi:Small-conductance mechanosensitive channel